MVSEELVRAIKERQAILFAGAGLSMAVGLPSWRELICHMADELDLERDEFLNMDRSYQTLAEYYRLRIGSIGPLRSWMDRNWSVSEEAVRKSEIHRLVVELDFPILYTTNYDTNLEIAFRVHGREFVKVANARDIANVREGVPQIIKFHGDFEDDQSLVLAESDYFRRLDFDSPLDIKFRADSLGRTILFVGYSMSDMNIRLLLYKLRETWKRSGNERDRPRSFVFTPQPNRVQEAILSEWGITPLAGEVEDPGEALGIFLADLRKQVGEN